MTDFNANAPDALLLLAPGCPHCPTVLQGLAELVKQGVIGRLETVNIAVHPDVAEKLGARSVPWVRLGEFELEGLHSPAELRQWAERAGSGAGLAEYYADLLKQGRLQKVLDAVHEGPQRLSALLRLAADPDTELTVRIGISAVIEDMAGSDALKQHFDELAALARSGDPRVRSDAAHFLALTRDSRAEPVLEQLTRDGKRAVREVAEEALQELREEPGDNNA